MSCILKSCSVIGCLGDASSSKKGARGFCQSHYNRFMKYGDPEATALFTYMDNSGGCAFDGCENKSKTKGYCAKHYARLWKFGDPSVSLLDRENKSKICRIDGCLKPKHAHGLCAGHVMRLKKTGNPNIKSLHDHVDRKIRWVRENAHHIGDDCLIWPFSKGDHGRGIVSMNGRNVSAPRAMCIIAHGEPPTKKHQAAHSCGMGHEGCINPRHLRWATPSENENDKLSHGTLRRGTKINTCKLTEDQVRNIRKAEGRSVKIAADFGVSYWTVWEIRTGRSWAWLA